MIMKLYKLVFYKNKMKGDKIEKIFIITGAKGFLGNNIVRKLIKDKNNEVRIMKLFKIVDDLQLWQIFG